MKKVKKGLSLLLCAIMTVSIIPVYEAEAYWDERFAGVMNDLYTPPEGYEEFESSDLYQKYSEYFDSDCLTYRSINDRQFFASYYYFEFSHLELTVSDDSWKEIYDKYSEELQMDSAKQLGSNTVRIMDWVNVGSEVYEDVDSLIKEKYESIEMKYDTLMKMASEMYETGCVETAYYAPFSATSYSLKATDFTIENYSGTLEELKTVVADVCENAAVKENTYDNKTTYHVTFFYEGATAEEYFAVVDAVESMEGEHTVNADIRIYAESGMYVTPSITSGTINIVAAIEENAAMIASCDTDQNGTVEITDATAILASYANTAAGIATVSEENSMDVNGDGTVGIDDATFVLTVYAELAAGLR